MSNGYTHTVSNQLLTVLAVTAILLPIPGVYFVMEQYNFLPLHTLLELTSSLLALMIFGAAWNSLPPYYATRTTFLGCALLAAGLLNLGHTLSYIEMPDFITPASPAKCIAFGLSGRLVAAAALCGAAIIPTGSLVTAKFRYALLSGFCLYALLIYWLVLFHPSILANTYLDEPNLTGFKKACEWTGTGLLVIAASLFWQLTRNTDNQNLEVYFCTSTVILLMSEILATLHTDETGAINLLSHIDKTIGYFLLYRAVFATAIINTYHKIEQQQAVFHQLFNKLPSCCVIYQAIDNGDDFIFLNVNQAAERTEKINLDNFIGQRVTALFPGMADFGLLEALRRVWQTGQSEHYPLKFYHDERIAGWREHHLYRLPDGTIAAAYDDFTERQLTDHALHQSEQHFRKFFESASIGMVEADPQTGNFLRVNAKFCQMTGYSEKELLTMSFSMITDAKYQNNDQDELQCLTSGYINEYTTEKRYLHKNGHIIWVQLNTIALRDEDDKVSSTLTVVTDITERNQIIKKLRITTYKLQEQQIELEMKNNELHRSHIELEESHDRYVDLYDFAPIGYLTLSDNGVICEINSTGAAQLGIPSKKALLRPLDAFLTPEACDIWRQHKHFTLQHTDKQSCELAMKRADDSVFCALLVCQRKDTSTSPLIRVSFTDITERKQLERQLQQSQKMQALGQLTGGIAHDFNNILAVMLGYSNLARTRFAADEETKLGHYLEEITKAGERARDLVTRMLAYSRSQSDELATTMEPTTLVEEVIQMLASTIPSGIKLQAQLDPDIPAINISPGELHQIVMNLAINARDAMSDHGELCIRLSTLIDAAEFCAACKQAKNNVLCPDEIHGGYVSLSVSDTGCGISAENVKLIFDPFFTTKDVGKGTGLGLSVIQGIVRRAGGCIIVDSPTNKGSTFQVQLPTAANFPLDLPIATTSLSATPEGNGARILVIDDEPALAHYLTDLLEGKNYAVNFYTDPIEALNHFRANPESIDAVITDLTMPNKSGLEIADIMLGLRPGLPIFLCSGFGDSIDENTPLPGIRRFFNKPVSAAELLIALNEELTYPADL